jgi:hypothetical protein
MADQTPSKLRTDGRSDGSRHNMLATESRNEPLPIFCSTSCGILRSLGSGASPWSIKITSRASGNSPKNFDLVKSSQQITCGHPRRLKPVSIPHYGNKPPICNFNKPGRHKIVTICIANADVAIIHFREVNSPDTTSAILPSTCTFARKETATLM